MIIYANKNDIIPSFVGVSLILGWRANFSTGGKAPFLYSAKSKSKQTSKIMIGNQLEIEVFVPQSFVSFLFRTSVFSERS